MILTKSINLVITGFDGVLRRLTCCQLTGPSLNSLFIKITTICETMEDIP